MKYIFTFLIISVVAVQLTAQTVNISSREIGGVIPGRILQPSAKSQTDTIFFHEFNDYSTAIYNFLAPGSGYILGTSWQAGVAQSAEQAQGYINLDAGYGVEGALIWTSIRGKVSANGSKLFVKLYKRNGTSNYTIDSVQYSISAPGTLLARDTVEYADIDTTADGFTVATFHPVPFVPALTDYIIGCDVSNFYVNHDTLSIWGGLGSASGVYGLEYTYYKYPSPVLWIQFSHIWTYMGDPLDMSIPIFPLVNSAYINVGGEDFANHMQLSQNSPNPSNGETSISYALNIDAEVTLEIFDSHGRKAVIFEEGHKSAGTYTISLCDQLTPGIYYYSLIAGNNRLTKKMCIE
jgi:hypothetical protein